MSKNIKKPTKKKSTKKQKVQKICICEISSILDEFDDPCSICGKPRKVLLISG